MNAESWLVITRGHSVLVHFGFFKWLVIFFELYEAWTIHGLNFKIAVLNLSSWVLILKLVLFFETPKLIKTLSHVIYLFHRARVSALVLRSWVSGSRFFGLKRGRSGDRISGGSCAWVSRFPSTLIQFILKSQYFCFFFSYLSLPLLNFRCNWLVNRWRLLFPGFVSQGWSLRVIYNNIGCLFDTSTVRAILRAFLILEIFFKYIIFTIRPDESMAAKKLLRVELIFSF